MSRVKKDSETSSSSLKFSFRAIASTCEAEQFLKSRETMQEKDGYNIKEEPSVTVKSDGASSLSKSDNSLREESPGWPLAEEK